MSTVAEKVRAAADYIDRTGLHKGDPYDVEAGFKLGVAGATGAVEHDLPCCTLGALWGHRAQYPRLREFIQERFEGVASIPDWNDAPERTKEEVVQTLREFADELEKETTDA